jgi:hypothetical protein
MTKYTQQPVGFQLTVTAASCSDTDQAGRTAMTRTLALVITWGLPLAVAVGPVTPGRGLSTVRAVDSLPLATVGKQRPHDLPRPPHSHRDQQDPAWDGAAAASKALRCVGEHAVTSVRPASSGSPATNGSPAGTNAHAGGPQMSARHH